MPPETGYQVPISAPAHKGSTKQNKVNEGEKNERKEKGGEKGPAPT